MKRFIVFALLSLSAICNHAAGVRILAYGDSNTFGWQATSPVTRLAPDSAWPAQLKKALGDDVEVIVEGLNGRTTDADRKRPSGAPGLDSQDFNGQRFLPVALSSHMPLDLVVIMLGTNDMNQEVGRSPQEIAQGLMHLANIARSGKWLDLDFARPKVLVVSPVPTAAHGKIYATVFPTADVDSKLLGEEVRKAATKEGIAFFDAATVIPVTAGADGLHLTPEEHTALGRALANEVRKLLKDSKN